MSDLISKKVLIKAILAERDKHPLEVEERYSFGVKVPCRFNQALRGGIRKCLHLVETAPTIDAVEVVHGEWNEVYEEDEKPFFRKKYYCSNCGDWNTYGETNYCPNCGAKMEVYE